MSSLKAAKGISLLLMSAMFASFYAQFIALASKDGIPSFQILFVMRLTEFLAVVPMIIFYRLPLTGENRHQNIMFVLYVILTNAATITHFLSFTFTVPGIAFGIIQGSMPFFVACIGFLVLNESLGVLDVCGILISVTGVVLVAFGVTQIGTMSIELLALSIGIPLLSSFIYAPDMILMRYMTATLRMPIFTSLLYLNLLGSVALLVVTYAVETPVWTMPLRTALYVAGVGVSKTFSSILMFLGMKTIQAYIATSVRMFTIPISVLLDYLVLQKVPNLLQAVGVVLVMLGIVVVSVYTWWTSRQKELQSEILETLNFDPDER